MNNSNISIHISNYFRLYLPGECGFSSATITSYRDTFKQLLLYCKKITGKEPEELNISDFTKELVREFLDDLEKSGKSVSTRNQRLAAIKSFFNYLKYESPENLETIRGILQIKTKKTSEPIVNYLSVEGVSVILHQPNIHSEKGFRDALILTLLYETGARVSEVTEIKIGDIRQDKPATIVLHGKGSKDRLIPLSEKTCKLIKSYLTRTQKDGVMFKDKLLFSNRVGEKLTRAGVAYILKKYVDLARIENPALIPEKFSPHCMRHSKAMHLLQAGVAIIYIRDFLGHSSIKTTEIYAKSDEKTKREALESAYSAISHTEYSGLDLWNENVSLMKFITELCKS